MKEQFEDYQDKRFMERLAFELGIPIDELEELKWKIHENIGNDDITYGYKIEFSDDSPKHILEKVEGLSKTNCVDLNMNLFL
ncbi:hypothetical protein WA1_23270 [Scytonema hofmannii PCC 7110]|uniref:Uncharacterized protein n=1 Tax=Scytonema hofmannii PCC 7110 TaxID=128403 RepID=A0A139X8K5_9CYAN|nr:hypothetical protein [Scytonema hofmannii]KYC41041.1 hypothetical protein WA1_23270 [Scytonema hofmannii PCC 7110]